MAWRNEWSLNSITYDLIREIKKYIFKKNVIVSVRLSCCPPSNIIDLRKNTTDDFTDSQY
jgi:hypothetical protein